MRRERWASKASWRLTFTVWSLVLVLWAVVTIVIDYDTLVVIRNLIGTRGRVPVIVLAVVVGLPMLVDVVRNASRNQRGRRKRDWNDATSRWETSTPAMTPRRCSDATVDLTWRERAIVEQGQLAYGVVVHHGELTSVRYLAPWGDEIASRPVVAKTRPREGVLAPLLFEPGAHVGVAPSVLGLAFLVPPADDLRSTLQPTSVDVEEASFTATVAATLHPVERLSRYCTADVGEVTLSDGKLTVAPLSSEPTTVRLDKPFRVELSVFLLAGARAELNMTIEPRTHSAYRAGDSVSITLKTELPQARLSRRLPQAWVDACYVQPAHFDTLWRAIVSYADDTSLTSSVAS